MSKYGDSLSSDFLTDPLERLIDEMAFQGISCESMAKMIGVSPSYMEEILKGKQRIDADMSMRLEDALGLDPEVYPIFMN